MKRKLSDGRSRADIISDFQALSAASPPVEAPKEPAKEPQPKAPEDIDTEVAKAIDNAIALQEKDPDPDGNDEAVLKALKDARAAQEADAASEPKPDAKAAATPVQPPANPVDDKGNVDSQAKCANADCGHLASSHLNEDAGKNTGACQMADCACLAMQVEPEPNTDKGDKGEGQTEAPPAEDKGAHAALAPAVVDAPIPTATETSDLNAPPEVEGGESMGPAFTIPVAIIEGQPTGDGRQISQGALTWRTPPVPLMGLKTETHDPEGFDMNDPAVLCGRIDGFSRADGEGSTQVISAHGFYLPNDDGMEFAELNEAMGRLGVSADVAVQASEVTIEAIDDMGFPTDMAEILTEGTIMGVTVCPFPAFEGAYIVLGDGSEKPAAQAIPQAVEQPEAVTAGGQLIHWMTYQECEPCDQGLEVITAAGAGPSRPPMAWFSDPGFAEGDGRLEEILTKDGRREGKFACPITVTDDGRVFGHIAPWNVCHTAHTGKCILAPHSSVDYAHFKRGQHVVTAEGEKVRVGVLTCDAGHASTRPGFSMGEAMAHYDNTALAVADVNIGEDDYGIWIAGAIRSDASEEQIRKLRASSISGDWRAAGGQLELVAALAVNQPGFPLAVVAGGQIETLVAAGQTVMHQLQQHEEPAPPEGDVTLRAALAPLLNDAKDRAKGRVAALR
ncbi:MAG TPA: hypothetical protein VGN13_12480 [Solirubrobacteraceae bacterium]|jgi:hypothetical protein